MASFLLERADAARLKPAGKGRDRHFGVAVFWNSLETGQMRASTLVQSWAHGSVCWVTEWEDRGTSTLLYVN